MSKLFEVGGLVAGAVLVIFGVVAIVMGVDGQNTVQDNLQQEEITGTPDMTPQLTQEGIQEAGLANVSAPSCNVADQPIDTGGDARCFAEYMRVHALESTGGYTYSEMGRFEAKPDTPDSELAAGGGTDNEQFAVINSDTGEPADNGARNIWVTETALATALNASYMADRLSVFGIVIGIALLLTGIGFLVLVGSGAVRDPQTVLGFLHRKKDQPSQY